MYKETFIPTHKAHTVKLPKDFYGKKVEIIVKEINGPAGENISLPVNLKDQEFWEDIPYNPSFPSMSEIRKTAWPEKK